MPLAVYPAAWIWKRYRTRPSRPGPRLCPFRCRFFLLIRGASGPCRRNYRTNLTDGGVGPRLLLPQLDQLLGQDGASLPVPSLGGLLDIELQLLLLPLEPPPVPLYVPGDPPQGLVVFLELF